MGNRWLFAACVAVACHGGGAGGDIGDGGPGSDGSIGSHCTPDFAGRALGVSGEALAAGDSDGDGLVDFVVEMSSIPSATPVAVVERNTGGGYFTATQFPSAFGANSMVLADFNGDGKLDLATAYYQQLPPGIEIRLGHGDATFGDPVDYPNSAGSNDPAGSLTAVDYDGDGKLDLVMTNGLAQTIGLLRGMGDGTFAPPDELALGGDPGGLVAGDFDGDGVLDIASLNLTSGQLAVAFGIGSGQFAAFASVTLGPDPEMIARFGSGARPSLAVVDSLDHTISVLVGSADRTFASTTYPVPPKPEALAVADLDGDGAPDVLVTSNVDDLYVLHGSADGELGSAVLYQSAGKPLAITDLDGDHVPDLLVAYARGPTVFVRGRGDGSFVWPVRYAAGSAGGPMGSGDIDGDGRVDVVEMGPQSATTLLANGHGFGEAIASPVDFDVGGPVVVDIDGDGMADLLAQNTQTVVAMKGNGHGGFDAGSAVATAFGQMLALDLNGDHVAELVISDAVGEQVLVFPNTGHGLGSAAAYPLPHAGALAAGDFDGDGKIDLVVTTYVGGSFLHGHGDGTFDAPVAIASTALAQVPSIAAADFDRDGKLDLVADTSESVAVLRGVGDGTFDKAEFVTTSVGLSGLQIVDVDGDGMPDIAGSIGTAFTFYRSRGDGTFDAAAGPFTGGFSSRLFDVDGDGLVDLVFEGSDGAVDVSVNTCR